MSITPEEAIKILTAKAECMRRETSGTDLDCNYRNCDECDLCYKQGTTGDQMEALRVAISALQEKDSLIARLKAEAIKRNILYMKSGDRYFVGFVDGVRLARSIVDGSIDEPKYVYPSEALDEQSRSD